MKYLPPFVAGALGLMFLLAGPAWGQGVGGPVAGDQAAGAQPGEAEELQSLMPTAEETYILECINLARANPVEAAQRCEEHAGAMQGVDQEMFLQELEAVPAAAPVFFEPRLMRAARAHTRYQALHGMGHVEATGQEGYTGLSPVDRCNVAGYDSPIAELVSDRFLAAEDVAPNFVVDPARADGTSTGGMQAGRRQRVALFNPEYTQVGIGYDAEGTSSLTIIFGRGHGRQVGGVIYYDADGDEFYTPGEGVSGAALGFARDAVLAIDSGAYVMEINERGGRLTLNVGPVELVRAIPQGSENVKIDFALSREEMQAVLEVQAVQERLVTAVSSCDIEQAKALAEELSRNYARTALGPWCREAEVALQMRQIYIDTANRYLGQNRPTDAELNRTVQQLENLHRQLSRPEWQAVGLSIGEAFMDLGRTGQIKRELISEIDCPTARPVEPLPEDGPGAEE